ncbi:FAD-dependent oxidoreductase [Alkalimarinus alittae]|uniref:FAD-dependent monooxygenase n=1 Tax=Alkalimarinus alittae TaxID=2961619 RepID=A0ABY6N3W0_9ALTE|nr:NAD(P)/FAD-dependent oxidoreductase [Alkalimarinus alittae]UZE96781.1 FAD-dependent monooxygenase [Alkalimarinus alittae]
MMNVNVNVNVKAVIVGASIAGCCTALRLAKQGIKVAIIEKQPSSDHYKKMCSHIIHPSGRKVLADLGVWDDLTALGAQATYMDVESQGGRLFYPFSKKPKAANIERRLLDSALRKRVGEHPNITINYGLRIKSLLREKRQVIGLTAEDSTGDIFTFYCSLVVAADGRASRVARLDECENHTVKNHRVALFSYFKGVSRRVPSNVWVLDKGRAYIACFPNSDKMLLSCYIPEHQFKEIKDNQLFYDSFVKDFVERKGIQLGDQVDDLFIAKDTSTLYRSPNSKGLVFVGDAFLAADPLTGIGCSWAMSSAMLLSQCVGRPLLNHGEETRAQSRWFRFKLNSTISIYNMLHRIKYLIPAYLMAWLSLKGGVVFNKRLFGLFAALLGKRSPRR